MYKYVNKKNISTTIGGISFTPYSGHTSPTPVAALDIASNGWDFDRYYNEVLANTSNDDTPIGEIRYFPSNPGNGWLKCDGTAYLRSAYPEYEGMRPHGALELTKSLTNLATDCGNVYSGNALKTIAGAILFPANSGIGRTTDGGSTYSVVSAGLANSNVSLVQFASGRVLAIVAYYSATKVAYSDDDGVSWSSPVTLAEEFCVVGFFKASNYVLLAFTGSSKIMGSSDGVTWNTSALPTAIPSGDRIPVISMQSPSAAIVFGNSPDQPQYRVGVPSLSSGATFGEYVCQVYSSAGCVILSSGSVVMSDTSLTGIFLNQYSPSWGEATGVWERAESPLSISPAYPVAIETGGVAWFRGYDLGFGGDSLSRIVYSYDGIYFEYTYLANNNIVQAPVRRNMINYEGTNSYILATHSYSPSDIRLTHITKNPLKFNAPGLAPKANTHPYVYTGA